MINSPAKQNNLNHSKRRNPDARSRYIPNEATMHHLERKRFRLPCGFTVGQSWAALKKTWKKFIIAKVKGDLQNMKESAKIIRKLQLQMGIRAHDFGEDVLSLQEEADLFLDTCQIEWTSDKVEEVEEKNDLEREPDYDAVMNDIPLPAPIPSPRMEIYGSSKMTVEKHILNPNSCPSQRIDSEASVVMHKISSHSCSSQPYPGGAIVQKRIFNLKNCPSQPYNNGGSVDEAQIEKSRGENDFQDNINSPELDEESTEENISPYEDDTELEAQLEDFPAYSVNEDMDRDPLDFAQDMSLESDEPANGNGFQAKVISYEIRKDKSEEYLTYENKLSDTGNEKETKRKARSCPYVPPQHASRHMT